MKKILLSILLALTFIPTVVGAVTTNYSWLYNTDKNVYYPYPNPVTQDVVIGRNPTTSGTTTTAKLSVHGTSTFIGKNVTFGTNSSATNGTLIADVSPFAVFSLGTDYLKFGNSSPTAETGKYELNLSGQTLFQDIFHSMSGEEGESFTINGLDGTDLVITRQSSSISESLTNDEGAQNTLTRSSGGTSDWDLTSLTIRNSDTGIQSLSTNSLFGRTVVNLAATSTNTVFNGEPANGTRSNFTGALGYEFQVLAPVSVTSLCRHATSTINIQDHKINLWITTDTVTPIATGNVTPGTTADANDFQCVSTVPGPVTLIPGSVYRITSNENNAGDNWNDLFTPSFNTTIIQLNGAYFASAHDTYPTNSGGAGSIYSTPSMKFVPSNAALAALSVYGTSTSHTSKAIEIVNSLAAPVFQCRNSGYCGILTTEPLTVLHVGGGSRTPTNIFTTYPGISYNATTTGAQLHFETSAGVEGGLLLDASGVIYAGAFSNHPYVLRTNNTDRLTIRNTGAIGVGTTSPWATLSVSTTSQQSALLPLFAIASTTNATVFKVNGGGHIQTGGATPTVSSCGTDPSISGNDTSGTITVGTGVVTACTMTFAAPRSNTPRVVGVVTGGGLNITGGYSAKSTTAVTFSFAATVAGGTFDYLIVE